MESQFDQLAALYEEMASWPMRKDIEIPTVLSLLGDLRGLEVLDFGCGTGMYARWMQARGAARVAGYDASEGMLAYARRRAALEQEEQPRPQPIQFLSTLPPDLDGRFDVVLGVYVLPYATTWDELVSMCRSMGRLLRPGGRLVTLPIHPAYAPDPEYYRPYGFRLLSGDPHADGGMVRLHLCHPPYDVSVDAWYWSAATLERALREAGFATIAWPLHQVSADGIREQGPEFFRRYLELPHAALLDCRKA